MLRWRTYDREAPAVQPARFSATLLARLRDPGPVVALTGAGVSAESGLATFRGPGGMWEGRDPTELATPEAFAADARTVWRFYAWRRRQAAAAAPNPAHRALAALERGREDFLLVTQNVDGLHERSGSLRIVRLHGSLWRLRCMAEGREFEDRRSELGPLPPRCACGGLLRPAVVWFGEALEPDVLAAARSAARRAALFLVIGTSATVYPAADLPRLARSHGAHVVEINPVPAAPDDAIDERLCGPAGRLLPEILAGAGIPMPAGEPTEGGPA
jgi:NAD-dependent deacetylase